MTLGSCVGERAPDSFDHVEDEVLEDLRDTFSPEFLNRVDEIVVFKSLERDTICEIVRRHVTDTVRMDLQFSINAFDHLVAASYNPAMGARPVRRAVQRLVTNPLSRLLLAGELTLADRVIVGYDSESREFTFTSTS